MFTILYFFWPAFGSPTVSPSADVLWQSALRPTLWQSSPRPTRWQ